MQRLEAPPPLFPYVFPQFLRSSSSKEGKDCNIIHLKLRAAEIPSSAQFEQTLQPGNPTIANLTKIIKRENNVKQGPKGGKQRQNVKYRCTQLINTIRRNGAQHGTTQQRSLQAKILWLRFPSPVVQTLTNNAIK